ncbi:MAG TPA: helix-turn-helix domain-containing protein [Phenylobacterium sp.]|uniref:TetR/AcrR family transcriptional regulator n=1 Tax=Phenylobacterium sp. TaxID=1871053 RepID=UPI002B476EB5|nr:helix-turn-helix domain-containing protein [Phenylobacterium sp.]HKR90140.1 helix-turn-helix domain-containing protein [Phenylobacterium sp.]
MSGPTRERRAEIGRARREKTRAHLLDTAARVIAQRGEVGATIEALIAEAGVARGTFYNYWCSREDLLNDLWDKVGHDPFRSIQDAQETVSSAAERFSISARLTIRRAATDPAWGWLVIALAGTEQIGKHELGSYPMVDLNLGIEQGCFRIACLEAARDMIVGATISAMKAVLTAGRSSNYPEETTRMLLMALGLTSDDAAHVAYAPLPSAADLTGRSTLMKTFSSSA